MRDLRLRVSAFALVLWAVTSCTRQADLTDLRSRLGNSDPGEQQAACTDAAALGPKAVSLVPDLVRLLGANDATTRRLAAYAIEEIGPGATSAVPQLKLLLGDTNRDIAVAAANTLSRIAPDAAPVEVGDVYWKRFQEPDPALASYKRGIELEPKNAVPYRRLAEVQQWLGQHDEAKRNQEIAEELSGGAK